MKRILVALGCFTLFAAGAACAQPPAPISAGLFAFTGQSIAPGTARGAALAGANRWLGDEPFHNPAVAAPGNIELTPVLQRVSRQDLRADNREYDETAAFFDVLGGWTGRRFGAFDFSVYAHQALLRHENFAFTRGINATPPATIEGQADQREFRAGLAVSRAAGAWRFGVAGEWSGRDDTYETVETSGSPESGSSHADFSGGAVGGQAGVQWTGEAPWGGDLTVGGAARFIPSLDVDGSQELHLLVGDSTASFKATRESGWEGGVSASLPVTPTFRVMVSAGGRTAQHWDGFGVTDGRVASWMAGGEFHAPDVPWTFRFGLGQEQQTDAPESRSGVLGLGFGWDFEGVRVDVGGVRRTLERASEPTSYEDRLVGSVVIGL